MHYVILVVMWFQCISSVNPLSFLCCSGVSVLRFLGIVSGVSVLRFLRIVQTICFVSVLNAVHYTVDFHTLQVKAIRKKMVEIISREVSSNDMKEVVNKL